ncbi:MAG: tetratricopeptide repeat protein [Blastocatellia bacterium]|jgi:tetratricopeptide (TPR) repeat protein|nr:tetratricopeptide repeat protein [Blastocatellia bacterium]
MARKNRRFDQVATAPEAPKDAVRYQDAFQQNVNAKLDEVGKKFEGNGRKIVYAVLALLVIALLVFVVMRLSRRSGAEAQAALGKAIETSQLRVTDQPVPAGSTEKTFKTEKERAEAAIAEFQTVVDKFGGSVGERAKYFIAVNRLVIDRAAGISELEAIAGSSSDNGKLAKFALAQTRADDGKFDEAVKLYQELIAMPDAIIAKDTLNFALAKVYEKQDKKKEAADLYFTIAKTAADAKDAEGKPIPMTQTARDAKDRVTELDPERAKEIVEPPPSASPFG